MSMSGKYCAFPCDHQRKHYIYSCGTNGAGYDESGWEGDDGYIVNHSATNDYNWIASISAGGVQNAAPEDVYKSVIRSDK